MVDMPAGIDATGGPCPHFLADGTLCNTARNANECRRSDRYGWCHIGMYTPVICYPSAWSQTSKGVPHGGAEPRKWIIVILRFCYRTFHTLDLVAEECCGNKGTDSAEHL